MPQSFEEAFPGGFEECVSTLGQEPSIDDPEKLCGWLQEHGFEAIRDAAPDTILAGLEVEFVSVVDEPAQDSEWLLAKSDAADEGEWTPGEDSLRTADVLLKADDEENDAEEADPDDEPEKKVWAAVLKPGEADAHGDMIPEPEIEKAAHTYLKEYRKVDADHDLLDGKGVPVESYIVRDGPETFETPAGDTREYPEGTWVMGVELSDEAWKRVETGELTGFSIYGGATKLNPDALLTEAQKDALSDLSKESSVDVSDLSRGDLQRLASAVAKELDGDATAHMQRLEKMDMEDLSDAVAAYEEATGESPGDTTLSEFVAWVQEEMSDSEDSDDEEEEETEDDEDEDDAQASKNDDDTTSDMGENDDEDILAEIRDTVKSTNEQVEKHSDRLESLREDLDETRKEVGLVEEESDEEKEEESEADDSDAAEEAAKAVQELRDDLEKSGVLGDEDTDEDEEVDRKAQKNAASTDEEQVEKEDDTGLNVSFGGITEEA